MSKKLDAFLTDNLTELREAGLYNEIDAVEGPNGAVIKVGGKDLINLSSNNCTVRTFEKQVCIMKSMLSKVRTVQLLK